MIERKRVGLSLSPEVFAALVYEAQRSGLPVSTYAASQVYKNLLPTLSSREYEKWRKQEGIESYASTRRAEERMIERMEHAEEAQEWTQAEPSTAKRQRS